MLSVIDHPYANSLLWTEEEWESPVPFAEPLREEIKAALCEETKKELVFVHFKKATDDHSVNAPINVRSLNVHVNKVRSILESRN